MSNFTVLGDSAIKQLLLDLSKEEIASFQEQIEDCLISICPGKEGEYQPSPGIINRPDGQKILFRPFTSPENVGTKIIVHPAPTPTGTLAQQALHGIVVLVDKFGLPTGVLNAEEITGYRTTMNAMVPYSWRRRTEKIVIFGAGKQALWHSRLALAIRGEEIGSITIVNRSEERAKELIQTVVEENASRWKSGCRFEFLNSAQIGAESRLRDLLVRADAIFCTVPSTKPLFSLEDLGLEKRHGRLPFISAVGSWQPDMIEVSPEILHHITRGKGFGRSGDDSTGTLIVDDEEHALIHAGEVVQGGLNEDQILGIGRVLSWKRDEAALSSENTKSLNTWLAEGLIVYKSIGVSVTDLVAGNAILALAAKKNLGTSITDF
ncbi:hypothetical protein N7532_010687 [Penicillium argentinense]|uniref:Ornithine cyclodeaminase n=1 Tax=Penicillium argentinense TaxID=1131581 RepID=A0A9W9EQD3_9EURO|nr:uncharacterized protein N7532_010687 [Penicillium argentinense]KAJ5085916.1 hypothetical protein N7532_010687 [Penicillium argentinense]